MNTTISLSSKLPANYVQVLNWKISEKSGRLVKMNLLMIFLAIIFGTGFYILVRIFGKSSKIAWSTTEILIFLIGIIFILALNEFVNGVAMQSFGAKPRYGFFLKGLMFYVKAPGVAFKCNQYIFIVLAPLVILSILVCLGIEILSGTSFVWILALLGIINASAASADLWITTIVLRYPASSFIVDEFDGMRIFVMENDMKVK